MTLLTPDSNSETADSTKDIKDTNKVVEYVVKLIIREDNTVFEFRNNDIILGWGIFIDLFSYNFVPKFHSYLFLISIPNQQIL